MRISITLSFFFMFMYIRYFLIYILQCKNVLFKLQRKIDKEGPQIVPLLTDLWKRSENTGYNSGAGNDNLLDLRKIDQRVERFDYNGVIDFLSDVQFMLKSAVQYFGFSHEVTASALMSFTLRLF